MKIAIYQINLARDYEGVAFMSLSSLEATNGSRQVNPSIYDKAFEGEVDANDIEDIYRTFNLEMPEGYKGRSLSVSDVVEIVEADSVEPGFYFCDMIGFKKIAFDSALTGTLLEKKRTIHDVIVEPGKYARAGEIGADLKSMQEFVDGTIEGYYPFDDPVAIVCNDEGKINGMPLNRAVYDESGNVMDIIAGTFFVCGIGEGDFCSLTEEQVERYKTLFLYPEEIVPSRDGIMVSKYEP